MEHVDVLVIGGGVIGLALGRAFARSGRETVVVEAGSAIGQGVSSRSSEVIHAGFYYTTGSLKAQLCVRGKTLLYAFCARHGVAHARCGKLVIASHDAQHVALRALNARAQANGVPAHWLSANEAMAMEPQLRCTAALHSPSTGIVDSHGLMLALQGELERHGGVLALHSAVREVDFTRGPGAVVSVDTPGGAFELHADCVVNAAGLHACALARHFHGLAGEHIPQPRFAKGNYFSLSGKSPFKRLIYPVPVDAWLGVHVTLDLAGQVRFGPDLQWLDAATPEAIDYRVDETQRAHFESAIRRYWPGLPMASLHAAYSGVRPKIHGPQEPAPDFRIDGPQRHGIAALVNLFGIESPGLTSALAIAELVAHQVTGQSLSEDDSVGDGENSISA